ncbi:non-heme iron oxygenase ferredoxin subunit [Paraburkholderia dipogonis]|uniref:Non-heme iron oxygenase ferredoxin subunit n=1 Tax=Paraburkholderia dipogonis TaxID=1211383 RepID=A0A4Y8MG82_9BURK|nr:non-heme iron oxygenase ferredoxin subunit [Paraburkholderia dipogonis]TFE36459.1 non-heme iron oxygenase ferredoxin subunit [Paraburkholderia dipogonis]
MSAWVEVAAVENLPPGTHRTVDVDGAQVAVFNVAGAFHAIEDVCTHDGGVLTGGEVQDDVVVCPRHGARFCIRTGKVLGPPAFEDVATFPVRVEGGLVEVQDARWD